MKKAILLIPVLAVLLIVLFSSVYIVNETQQVVITQFGRPVGEAVTTPGLNFKVPFIQKVNYFDKRYLEWDGDASRFRYRIWANSRSPYDRNTIRTEHKNP